MTTFYRRPHWRVSINGNVHWVSGHEVDRVDWSTFYVSPVARRLASNAWIESYTRPNARCPVCGIGVFFYQSPDGGRVFFDQLGPPWPKHPCTDNVCADTDAKRRVNERRPLGHLHVRRGTYVSTCRRGADRPYQWQSEGWKPALRFEIRRVAGLYRVRITNPYLPTWDGQILFFMSSRESLHGLAPAFAHYKREYGDIWRMSFWWPSCGASIGCFG
jgi:hypothetical protein